MEKFLVTGATGFIGKNIALKLANSGYKVHALYRSLTKTAELIHPNISLFEGDILNIPGLERAMESCTGIFHLAAFAKAWSKDSGQFYKVNYTGTVNVLESAIKFKVNKIVFTSTAGVLGPSDSESLDETTRRKTAFFFEYERTKWLAEEIIRDYVQNGLNVVIVNPSRVYGPGLLSDSNGLTKMIQSYCNGKWRLIPGNGRTIANYVYIDDVVNGHIQAYNKGQQGEKYILGGENISYNDFFNLLIKLSGKKFRLFKIPPLVLVLISTLMILITRITGKPPLITPGLVKKFLSNCSLSSEKARNDLGYNVTSLEAGITKTIRWLILEKSIKK